MTVALAAWEAVDTRSPIFHAGTALTQATAIAATAHHARAQNFTFSNFTDAVNFVAV